MTVGVYPGSFNPPTVAHLAIAEATVAQLGLERVDLVLARTTLGKHDNQLVALDDRLAVLTAIAADRPWLGVVVSDGGLIVEQCAGYDVVVLGADKWCQVTDPTWYSGDPAARDAVVAALPRIAYAPRAGEHAPVLPLPGSATVLDVHEDHHAVSATDVRAGRLEWMAPEARAFAERTGAWIDPARYEASRGMA